VCREETPPEYAVGEHQTVTCFRADEEHAYWQSEPITESASHPTDDAPPT
jgi:peptide/nickel transport system ATP-binding protein